MSENQDSRIQGFEGSSEIHLDPGPLDPCLLEVNNG
jgi:hypothetical protein